MPKKKPECEIEASPNEVVGWLKQYHSNAWDLERLLDVTEEQAREQAAPLKPYTMPDGTTIMVSGEETPTHEDASTLLYWIGSLRKQLDDPDINTVTLALKLGALAEKMGFRPLESYAKIGAKVKQGGAKGHRQVHGDQDEKKATWAAMKKRVAEILAENDIGVVAARKRVAKEYGVSDKTVQRAEGRS